MNYGPLSVINSTFANNTATSGTGGAIYSTTAVADSSDGVLSLLSTAFNNCSAAVGGAVAVYSTESASIRQVMCTQPLST
jgi:predicted outer membrane repeat protein